MPSLQPLSLANGLNVPSPPMPSSSSSQSNQDLHNEGNEEEFSNIMRSEPEANSNPGHQRLIPGK